jgi:hypothetical protein
MKVWPRTAAGLLGTALVLYPLALVRVTYVTSSIAIAAAALLLIASFWGSWAVTAAAIAALVLEYTAALLSDSGRIDLMAPVIGVTLVVYVELIDLVATTKPKVSLHATVLWGRAAFILRAAAAGGAAAMLALAGGLAVRGGHAVLLIIAATSVLGAFATAAGLATGALSADGNRSDGPGPLEQRRP